VTETTPALVFEAKDAPMARVRVAVPTLGPGEVLVRVRCCTLCGSDLHTMEGRRSVGAPMVLGHEIVGTVEAVGAGGLRDTAGRELGVGDRIAWAVAVACRACAACERGAPEHCTARFKYGHAAFDRWPLSGGLAGHAQLVAGTAIERVPEGLSDAVAATATCAGATVAAALRHAGDLEDRRVALFGAGMLGLSAAAFARALGAAEVIAVDVDPARAERAQDFGATASVGPDRSARSIRDVAPDGVDVALELSGASPAAAEALAALRVGGHLVLVGAVAPAPPIEVLPEDLVRRRLTITGVHNYLPEDLRTALDLLARADAPFAGCAAPPRPLDELEPAIESARRDGFLRATITPWS